MLKRLYLKNVFTHAEATFDFEKGMTAITGPNESGKSLILEMVRYALFGSAALRGSAEDLKRSTVSLQFTVKDVEYLVTRERGRATLDLVINDGNDIEPIASSTTAVNQRILSIFGYGLAVFDIANVANQGEIEALGNMRPSDRKRMVDSVIGLNIIDDLIKRATDEAASLRRVVESLNRGLTEPVKPEIPLGYAASEALRPGFEEALTLKSEKDQLVGWLSHTMQPPDQPHTDIRETSGELEEYQRGRQKIVDNLRTVNSDLSRIVLPQFTAEDLERVEKQLGDYRSFQKKQRLLTELGPKPELDDDEIEAGLADWHFYNAWKQKETLLAQGHVCCDNCGHEVPIAQAELERAGLVGVESAEEPKHPKHYYETQRSRAVVWDAPNEALAELADIPDMMVRPIKPHGEAGEVTEAWLERAWDQLKQAEKFPTLQAKKAHLEAQLPPDRSEDLRTRILYEAKLAAYCAAKDKYEVWINEKKEREERLAEIGDVDGLVAELQKMIRIAEEHERAWKAYIVAEEDYQARKAEVDKQAADLDQHVRARNALQNLKVRIKGFLVPSLNKVASLLLQEMTGGNRKVIEIDEDFEIKVDGQPLGTLSGSGKAVANLAIRIGLGRVLTSSQFSVFLGDELDASMDADRAGFTAECLKNLTSSISQVVLVSHKDMEADNYIQLAA